MKTKLAACKNSCKQGSCISVENLIGDGCKNYDSLKASIQSAKTNCGKILISCSVSVEIPSQLSSVLHMMDSPKMGSLLDTSVVEVKIGDDKEFQVHKGILTFWSKVFEAMFNVDMKEAKNNAVNLHDIEAEVF